MKHPQAPEIFQKPIATIDLPGLPPRGSPDFGHAVIARYALEYASKGWNAVVTVDDEFVRVVAIPEHGIDPKKYVLGLLQRALRQAIHQDPENAYAKRNLAAVLARSGKGAEALPLFRQAASLAPTDAGTQLGLAQCLDGLGGDHRKEADKVYAEIIRRFADHPAAEIAKVARNKIADEQLHDTVDGNVRMDAVFYMQGAMDEFVGKTKQEIGRIVMEIGLLGQSGLQINKPEVRYSLKSLPGDFSGLQLMSIMHAGIRLLDQNADTGTGLDREYELAMAMRGKK